MQWVVAPLRLAPQGASPTARLANNSLTVGGLVVQASSMGIGTQDCLDHLRTGVATNTCCAPAQGIDFLSLAKKPPMSMAWGTVELDSVWLGQATVARGSAQSRWASSCSSMLDLCFTATGAASGGTSGTSGSFTLGTLLRAAEGVPLAFFFFGISPAASVSTFLFFFYFLSPFCFFSRGASKVTDPGSLPWHFLHLTAFLFPSPGGSSGLVFLAFFFLVVLSDMDPSAPFSESFPFWGAGLPLPPPFEPLVPVAVSVTVLRVSPLQGPTKSARPPSSNSSLSDSFLSGYLIA